MFNQINKYFDSAFARAERNYLTPAEGNPVFYCAECGEGIKFDDEYYRVADVVYCKGCVAGMRRTVSEDDLYWDHEAG